MCGTQPKESSVVSSQVKVLPQGDGNVLQSCCPISSTLRFRVLGSNQTNDCETSKLPPTLCTIRYRHAYSTERPEQPGRCMDLSSDRYCSRSSGTMVNYDLYSTSTQHYILRFASERYIYQQCLASFPLNSTRNQLVWWP